MILRFFLFAFYSQKHLQWQKQEEILKKVDR